MKGKSDGAERRKAAVRRLFRGSAKYLLLAAGAALIALGIGAGEPAEVLRKAAAVCLECIGVG